MPAGRLSTRRSLVLLILTMGCFTVAVETTVFAVYEHVYLKREAVSEARALAETVGRAAMEGDAGAALSDLAPESRVLGAQVFDRQGRPLGEYRKPGSREWRPPAAAPAAGAVFGRNAVVVTREVERGGQRAGSIVVAYDLRRMQAAARRRITAVAVALLVILLIRMGAAVRLMRFMTAPLCYLAGVARDISARKDYTVRAERRGRGEVLELIGAFNGMLDQIETRERARQEAENRLRESEERYALAARGSNDGLWDYDVGTGMAYLSPRLNGMYGDPEIESRMTMAEWLGRIHPEDRERVQRETLSFMASTRLTLELEYRIEHADGSHRWMHSRGAVVRDENGAPLRIAGSQRDVTEAKTTDPLTGLPNRFFLLDRIHVLNEAARDDRGRAALLFIDLDHYKLVNESLGRTAGEELLPQVAGRLRSVVRTGATEAMLAHTGDDEFCVLFPRLEAESDAAAMAARILSQMQEPFFIEGKRLAISASIGLAVRGPGMTAEELLLNAETAMYHASTLGRGQFAVFQKDMRRRAMARLEILTGLRRAIEAGQLVLHYQPVVSLRERRIIGFESLVRWQHPERGLLGPGEFIPAAEESDLILDVGRWVLREACRQMAEWERRYSPQPRLTVGVNLSARQIQDSRLAEEAGRIVEETGLRASRLRLEITESSLVSDGERVVATLEALRRMGIGLVIDDFGTGYSSLSYLQHLPFSALKIDRSFVRELGIAESSTDIIRTILDLGRSLRLKVIAEGVESAEQVTALAALGCDLVQGYYFARPGSAEETEPRIADPGGIYIADGMDVFPLTLVPEGFYFGAEPSA